MRQTPIHNGVYLFLGLALASSAVISQPISPTSDVKSTTVISPTSTTPLELPYKPIENPIVEQTLNPDGTAIDPNVNLSADPNPDSTTATTSPTTAVDAEKKYSFDNIPYLALKYPEVKPLFDPE